MANSADPDQTAPSVWSGFALFAYAILSETLVYEILRHLPYSKYSDTVLPYSTSLPFTSIHFTSLPLPSVLLIWTRKLPNGIMDRFFKKVNE